MTIQEIAKQVLIIAIQRQEKYGDDLIYSENIVDNLQISDQKANQVINYLHSGEYIKIELEFIGQRFPAAFRLTAKGINWATDYEPKPQNFNISVNNNYGSIGNNNTITFDNHIDFKAFDEAVNKNLSENSPDYQEIQRLRAELEKLNKTKTAATSGIFNRFSGLMQRHSWLSGAVAGQLIRFFFGV